MPMAKPKTVMVRLLLDLEPAVSDEAVVQCLRVSAAAFATRMWIAVDHPQPEHAAKLWQAIAAGVDPHGAGSARKAQG
jgi:hypothetical protein